MLSALEKCKTFKSGVWLTFGRELLEKMAIKRMWVLIDKDFIEQVVKIDWNFSQRVNTKLCLIMYNGDFQSLLFFIKQSR